MVKIDYICVHDINKTECKKNLICTFTHSPWRATPSMMMITVGQRKVTLPPRPCFADDVLHEVQRLNAPFVVKGPKEFKVRRRVFLTANGVRVECDNEHEVRLACKLCAEEHNQWQTSDDTRRVMRETEEIEEETKQRLAQPDDSPSDAPVEEEDISIEEWSQMGYKWFRREDVLYI